MKIVLLIIVIIQLLSLTQQTQRIACPENRPEMCIDLWSPVCGYGNEEGEFKTYGNSCHACADINVIDYEEDECEQDKGKDFEIGIENSSDFDIDEIQKWFQCTKEQKEAEACTMEFRDTCGITVEGYLESYGNPCSACASKKIDSYFLGSCDEMINDMDIPSESQDGDLIDLSDDTEQNWKECPEQFKNADFCYEIFIETCGLSANGEMKKFSNDCDACSTEGIEFFRFGLCDDEIIDYAQDSELENETQNFEYEESQLLKENNINKCDPEFAEQSKNTGCIEIYSPVCAFTKNGKVEFENYCFACIEEDVQYYLDQSC